jgi:hypothetical protein
MVSNDLVLPKIFQDDGQRSLCLFDGALPHLRVSLYAFGMASLSPADGHVAQCGLVSMATQSGVERVIKEEWGRLLHRLVDDQTDYTDIDFSTENNPDMQSLFSDASPNSTATDNIDLHQLRGQLLHKFLIRVCESRHYTSTDFLQYAVSSLTDAIEMQVDRWTVDQTDSNVAQDDGSDAKMNDSEKQQNTTSQPPGVLVALLLVAKTLFSFLLPLQDSDDEDDEENESEDCHRRDMLISCGIQLIHHWEQKIANEACSMLVSAFSYSGELWDDYVGAVFASISLAIESAVRRNCGMDAIEGLISTLSQRSLVFAEDVLRLLLCKLKTVKKEKAFPIFKLVAAIATSCPSAALSKRDAILDILRTYSEGEAKRQLLASLLACRKAIFFTTKDKSREMSALIEANRLNQLDSYYLARYALQIGHPVVAKMLFGQLMSSTPSRSSYLWFTALEQIASGEALLATNATLALSNAAAFMKNAKSSLQYLSSLTRQPFSAKFQLHWLDLRVSHLDMLRVLRQLSQEMRLTGDGPKKNARPHVHLTNAIKFLEVLAKKYQHFRKQYGLFICRQSRSVLRTLQGHCSFVATVARKMFFDSLPDAADVISKDGAVIGDRSQPLTLFAEQLQKVVLKKLDPSVGGKIRAAAMLQILDGTVTVPFPIPRALTVAKVLPNANFNAFWDPSEHNDVDDNPIHDVVSVPIMEQVKFQVSGKVPAELVSAARLPFQVILVWLAVHPVGISDGDNTVTLRRRTTTAVALSPCGSFFSSVDSPMLMKGGRQKISITLGCRDIHGGEWELPTQSGGRHFLVDVAAPT